MRLMDRDGEILFTMTAVKGITELVSEIFEDHDVIESRYAPLLDETIPTIAEKGGIRFYGLWTTDNPHIDQPRVIEETKLMTRQEIKSRIYGIPVNLSGRIYPNFSKDIHVVPVSMIPTRKVCIWHVLDPHDRKPWFMTWWVVDRNNRAYCVREYPWRRNFNEIEFDDKAYSDYAVVIREVEQGLIHEFGRTVSRRIIDPNYGSSTERMAEREGGQTKTTPKKELKKLGLNYIDGIDALEAGHLQCRKWLHYEKNDKGEWVTKPQVYISEECENMIRHLSRYSRKDIITADGDVRDSSQPLEKHKDGSDNLRYLLMANPRYIERLKPQPDPIERAY